MNIHSTVKFWGRKDPSIYDEIIRIENKYLDPFCGSGTTGYVSVLRGSSALLSDLNPVAVFISANLLNDFHLDVHTIKAVEKKLLNIEKKFYSIKSYTLHEATYKSSFRCPKCKGLIEASKRDAANRLICTCGEKFHQRECKEVVDRVISVKVREGTRYIKIDPKYYLNEVSTDCWYPKRKFEYYSGKKFEDRPNTGERVNQIFFPRGLCAAAETFDLIESFKDLEVRDFLKLVFIASLYSATKMIPNSKTSGASWKIPRYWTPPEKVERNFIQTFLRRLKILNRYKKEWSEYIEDYEFFVNYSSNADIGDGKYISITRVDARDLDPPEIYDAIIMDPPHYDEIKYFEMTFLWQCWLRGRKDKRFKDFSFWKKEIDVNKALNRSVYYFNDEMTKIVEKYINYAPKVYLILHNSSRDRLSSTLNALKKRWNVELNKVSLIVPTSAQGIHGRKKKHLFLLEIRN